jgi:hypothetical protein
MRAAVVGVTVAALSLAAGCRMPSERAAYEVAAAAVRGLSAESGTVEPQGIRQATIFVNKNMACVELPATVTDAGGASSARSYVVWCKRVARRWELDRVEPKPSY